MEVVTRLPGGHVIVFVLAVADRRAGVRRAALGDAAARTTRAEPQLDERA